MRRERGSTLVETVISAGVFVAVAGFTFAIVRDTSGAVSQQLDASTTRRHADDAHVLLADEVGDADPATFAIDVSDPLGDELVFQLALPEAGDGPVWGARLLADGASVDVAGAFVRYSAEQGSHGAQSCRLVRRVTDAAGAPLGGEQVVVEALEAPDDVLGKGFTATRAGNLVTLRLRLRRAHAEGAGAEARTHEVVVRLRNG